MRKKLQLEILDPVGNTAVTHHFFNVYGESENVDFLIRLREIIKEVKELDDGFNDYLKFLESKSKSKPKIVLDNSGSLPETASKSSWRDNIIMGGNPNMKVALSGNIVPLGKDLDTKHTYAFNKDTGETQKLFCEETLIPTWTVRYEDPTRGNKGESVTMTVSANSEDDAKVQALGCRDFTQHILPEHYDSRYLTAFKARGNYVIGEIQYFEGDPRL